MSKIPQAHLINNKNSKIDNAGLQGYPLFDNPFFNIENKTPEIIRKIIDYLNVEKSKRYQPLKSKNNIITTTYCNVYAYDVCYLYRIYIPRVWWYQSYINRQKDKPENEWGVIYRVTVQELNANALFNWFRDYSLIYDWKKINYVYNLQDCVNRGGIGIIIGKNNNPKKSGHISIVIAETQEVKAKRFESVVVIPIQSMAGGINKKITVDDGIADWFLWDEFKGDMGFYWHE